MAEFIFGGPKRFQHQRRALESAIRTGGRTGLLLDPGLGKTAVVLDYAGLLTLKNIEHETRVLVVCPLAAVDTWVGQAQGFLTPQIGFWAEALGGSVLERAEALASRGGRPYLRQLHPAHRREKLLPARGASSRAIHSQRSFAWAARSVHGVDLESPLRGPEQLGTTAPRLILTVINIDTLAQRTEIGSANMSDVLVDAIKRYAPHVLVVDESHKIKSPSGNASRLLARVSKSIPRRLLLTGTVMPHSPLDVWAQWRTLDPYAFHVIRKNGSKKPMSFGEFKNRYAKMGGFMGKVVRGYDHLDEMQDIMGLNSIVIRKADALDLPATTEVTIPVELSDAERKAYDAMKNDIAVQLGSGQLSNPSTRMTTMLRLRQITAGHLPDDDGRLHVIGHSKVNTIRSLVHDVLTGEKRVVVFAYFKEEIRQLAAALAEKGTTLQVITGDTHTDARIAMRQRFGSDDPTRIVMVAQITTMSLAVNELITAAYAIFASLSQRRDELVQARDRLDRIGQTRPVTYYFCNAPGTVDDVILKTHKERGNLEAALLKHIQDQS